MIMEEFGETVTTCFKDAILGNNKIATFYQYGFLIPQAKIQNKELNGIYVRDDTILQRLWIKDAFDEICLCE